ncbi:MAG: hypothetical protein ABSB60_02380 [Terracidiphilus sp.]|jgi:hypothetical protein
MNSKLESKSRIRQLPRAKTVWIGLLAGLTTAAIVMLIGQGSLRAQFPHVPPEITRTPDINEQNDINQNKVDKQNVDAINAVRKKQIADESAQLLKLATDLKTEVDKTNKDTLSIMVIRKADAIEKLAHDVKEKMKLSVGAS